MLDVLTEQAPGTETVDSNRQQGSHNAGVGRKDSHPLPDR
jgi:hypothetical protein